MSESPSNESERVPEEVHVEEITINTGSGILKFGSFRELMEWKAEQNENAD